MACVSAEKKKNYLKTQKIGIYRSTRFSIPELLRLICLYLFIQTIVVCCNFIRLQFILQLMSKQNITVLYWKNEKQIRKIANT